MCKSTKAGAHCKSIQPRSQSKEAVQAAMDASWQIFKVTCSHLHQLPCRPEVSRGSTNGTSRSQVNGTGILVEHVAEHAEHVDRGSGIFGLTANHGSRPSQGPMMLSTYYPTGSTRWSS